MLKLGVNVDHVATLRQARGTDYPDPVEAAGLCEKAGAHGITAHLREDRRHIRDSDIFALRKSVRTRLNLEMADTPQIVKIALRVRPDEACIVPERRRELTTEGGLDAAGSGAKLGRTISRLSEAGITVSLFLAPDQRQIRTAAMLGAPCVELHTGVFCDARGAKAAAELKRLVSAARLAHDLGLQVNAGHGINMSNIRRILRIPFLDTLNIGHSIVARSVFLGMEAAVREMLVAMEDYNR